jgi:hypothetical protein
MEAAREMLRRYECKEEAPAIAAGAESARVDAAGQRPQWHAEVYVDTLADSLCRAYHALPERLYILRGPDSAGGSGSQGEPARVVYQGGEGPFSYSLPHMAAALERACGVRMEWLNMRVQ